MLSDQMKALTEAIEASHETRRAALSALTKETHETLRNFHQEREEMARALKTTLSNETRERREKTHELLSSFANEHQEMATSLRSELSSFQESLSRSVDDLMSAFSNDRRQARAYWDNLTKAMRSKRAG